jgi:hypothetical protein
MEGYISTLVRIHRHRTDELCWQANVRSRTIELGLPCYHSREGDDLQVKNRRGE